MKLWIARNLDNDLTLHYEKPTWYDRIECWSDIALEINPFLFPRSYLREQPDGSGTCNKEIIMTQEDKELLLKDIYARIPHEVKGCCEGETFSTTPLHWYAEHTLEYSVNYMIMKHEWRPYLFPISSMTDEQKDEYHNTCNVALNRWGDESYYATDESIDWLNAHHFDYRGLIPKGLAIDATGLNVY